MYYKLNENRHQKIILIRILLPNGSDPISQSVVTYYAASVAADSMEDVANMTDPTPSWPPLLENLKYPSSPHLCPQLFFARKNGTPVPESVPAPTRRNQARKD